VSRKRKIPEGLGVLSIRLPEELLDDLREIAKRNDRTMTQEARRALAFHINAERGEDEEEEAVAA
jgi:predicted transcriptional regulator